MPVPILFCIQGIRGITDTYPDFGKTVSCAGRKSGEIRRYNYIRARGVTFQHIRAQTGCLTEFPRPLDHISFRRTGRRQHNASNISRFSMPAKQQRLEGHPVPLPPSKHSNTERVPSEGFPLVSGLSCRQMRLVCFDGWISFRRDDDRCEGSEPLPFPNGRVQHPSTYTPVFR